MAGSNVALLVLAGVFIGMWIPVSLQLWATLRSCARALDGLGTRGTQTLAQLSDAALGIKQTAEEVEELVRSANQLRDSLRVFSALGAALGPAAAAMIHALRETPAKASAPQENGGPRHVEEWSPGGSPARPDPEGTSHRSEGNDGGRDE